MADEKIVDASEKRSHFRRFGSVPVGPQASAIDPGTASGRFFFHVMASLAEMERELTIERTRAGLEVARQRRPPTRRSQQPRSLRADPLSVDSGLSPSLACFILCFLTEPLLLDLGPGVFERESPVEDQIVRSGIGIKAEVPDALELKAILKLRVGE